MSEWRDNQKKPKADFRKLPQERINAKWPMRGELTDEEQQRIAKLESVLGSLRRGENAQNRQLKCWLFEGKHKQIEREREAQKSFREDIKDKLSEIKQYENKLKKGIFERSREKGFVKKH